MKPVEGALHARDGGTSCTSVPSRPAHALTPGNRRLGLGMRGGRDFGGNYYGGVTEALKEL